MLLLLLNPQWLKIARKSRILQHLGEFWLKSAVKRPVLGKVKQKQKARKFEYPKNIQSFAARK